MTASTLPTRRRWGNGGKTDPVAVYVAPNLGLTVKTTEHLMKYINHRCAAVIDGFNALDEAVRLTRFMEPIDAALARIRRPAYSIEVVRCESETDQAEQVAQDILNVAPSRDAALLWIRRSQAARAAALRLELAVAAKWQLLL